MHASSAAPEESNAPGGYVPLALRPDWVLERYYGWSVVAQESRCKILRRRAGPRVRHLVLVDGMAQERLDALARDRRVFHPLGITSLNDFAALGEEALRRMAGRTLRRVTRRRWFGVGTFVHDLGEDEATLWRRVAARERTKCASAVRAGVTVDFADRPGDEKLREFLRLYDRLAIERALEMLSLEMLQTMFRGGHLTLARAVDREGRTLVANVVHRAHDHGYFLLGARGAGAAPGAGHLIHWETIRKLKGDGYRFYDLGLVTSRDSEDGIYRFKRSLGGTFVSSGAEFEWSSPLLAALRGLRATQRTVCMRLTPVAEGGGARASADERGRRTSPSHLRHCLLVGVRGHGGEEVYSRLLRDRTPQGFDCSATIGFHTSCERGRSMWLREVLLNRLVHPWLRCNQGFRVVDVAPEVDLVHVHTHPTVLRNRGDRPVVFSAGSSHYHWLRDYERWPEERIERAYERAKVVYRRLGALDALLNHGPVTLMYTFSRYARDVYLANGVPEWKVRVLYPGFDISEPSRPATPGLSYLFLGRDPRRKGGDLVLAAFRRVRSVCPEAQLMYVTDEPPSAPLRGVEVIPLVAPSAVADLYRRAHIFVNPTTAEGFGFTNVEAQGFGLPVISTRVGAIPEVVDDGKTGLLVPPRDEAALYDAMLRLAMDTQLRVQMGIAGRRRFEAHFSIGTFRASLGELYEEAVQRARLR